MVNLLVFSMTQSRLLAATKVSKSERGSAVVGFVVGAPLIALIATYCISLSGYVWSRELISDAVREQLHAVSIGEVSRAAAQAAIRESLSQRDWLVESMSWNETMIDGATVLSLQVCYRIDSALLLPSVTISESDVLQ
ncbi:MAG: hypothetical protein RL410_852 [Actinomycetota bacterium]